MKNLHTVELRLNAENHIVDRKELCVDHKLQMRTQMDQQTIEEYAGSISAILEASPLDVVEVETETDTRWYIVDGFHRYHAAVQAEVDAINIRLMKGTYDDAVQYAMSANWENGLRPKSADAARSIHMLLKTAPDFGYDSKSVNKWLTSFGIPASTVRNHTKELIADIKAKRDAEIIRLDAEGKTQREIAEVVSCDQKTVSNLLKEIAEEKCPLDKTPQEETPDTESSPFPADEPFFNKEALDATQALNPADAFQKALSEHEEERTHQQQDKTDVSIAPSDVEDVLDAVVKLCAYQSDTVIEATLKKCELKRSAIKRLANLV